MKLFHFLKSVSKANQITKISLRGRNPPSIKTIPYNSPRTSTLRYHPMIWQMSGDSSAISRYAYPILKQSRGVSALATKRGRKSLVPGGLTNRPGHGDKSFKRVLSLSSTRGVATLRERKEAKLCSSSSLAAGRNDTFTRG